MNIVARWFRLPIILAFTLTLNESGRCPLTSQVGLPIHQNSVSQIGEQALIMPLIAGTRQAFGRIGVLIRYIAGSPLRVASAPMFLRPLDDDSGISGESPEVSYLPSLQSLRERARLCRLVVFENVDLDAPLLKTLAELSPRYVLLQFQGGAYLGADTLRAFAEFRNVPVSQIRESIGIPDWAEGAIITTEIGVRHFGAQRAFLEELFHHLEGRQPHAGRQSPAFVNAREVVNDLLQLLLYPRNQASNFHSQYTKWTDSERLALMDRYRDSAHLDPNSRFSEIIQRIADDVRKDTVIHLPGTLTEDMQYLPGGYRRIPALLGSVKPEDLRALNLYLSVLTQGERFQEASPLFPEWDFVPHWRPLSPGAELASRYIPRGAPTTLLSLGSGAGQDEIVLAQRFPELRVRGVDIDEFSLRSANLFSQEAQVESRAEFAKMDMLDALRLTPPASQDIILANLSLHLLSPADWDEVFRLVGRALKPDGKFVVIVKSSEDYWANHPQSVKDPDSGMTTYFEPDPVGPRPLKRYFVSKEKLLDYVLRAGLIPYSVSGHRERLFRSASRYFKDEHVSSLLFLTAGRSQLLPAIPVSEKQLPATRPLSRAA